MSSCSETLFVLQVTFLPNSSSFAVERSRLMRYLDGQHLKRKGKVKLKSC